MDDANNPAEGGLSPALPKQAVAMAIPAWNAWPSHGGSRDFSSKRLSWKVRPAAVLDDLPIIKLDESCNEAAFMDERKAL